MHVTKTINYGWINIRSHYSVDCQVCKKTLHRSVSSGYNEMTLPEDRASYQVELNKEAEKESKIPVTCNKCLIERIGANMGTEAIKAVPDDVIRMADGLYKEFEQHSKALSGYLRGVSEVYRGQIIIAKNEEWVIDSIDGDLWHKGVYVNASRINKVKPWLETNKYDSFKLTEILLTAQTLKERQEQVDD